MMLDDIQLAIHFADGTYLKNQYLSSCFSSNKKTENLKQAALFSPFINVYHALQLYDIPDEPYEWVKVKRIVTYEVVAAGGKNPYDFSD